VGWLEGYEVGVLRVSQGILVWVFHVVLLVLVSLLRHPRRFSHSEITHELHPAPLWLDTLNLMVQFLFVCLYRMLVLLLFEYSTLSLPDWWLVEIVEGMGVEIDKGMRVCNQGRWIDLLNCTSPLIKSLWVVIFGDEDDKFVESVRGCGEDLLERGEYA
jgi:hypothetical protein